MAKTVASTLTGERSAACVRSGDEWVTPTGYAVAAFGMDVAFAIIDRPRDATDLDLMLEVLRRCLARHYQGKWPGMT